MAAKDWEQARAGPVIDTPRLALNPAAGPTLERFRNSFVLLIPEQAPGRAGIVGFRRGRKLTCHAREISDLGARLCMPFWHTWLPVTWLGCAVLFLTSVV